MSVRILPLLEIACKAELCWDCCFLREGPQCGLFTGHLEKNSQGKALRAEECSDAEMVFGEAMAPE